MKKGLFVLFSDNVNLSLVNLYRGMSEAGFQIDCYAARNDALSLHCFENVDNVNWIYEVTPSIIKEYEFIVCGRNCFDCLLPELVIDYTGLIFTDNTAFYEGRNVYGDVVFVNGKINIENLENNVYFDVYSVGCLKALSVNDSVDNVWKETKKYENNILYIESGHYPFGKEARIELAKSIANMVFNHPRCLFVVKPRFLLGEAEIARHRNEDYLYFYLHDCFEGNWPENLIWLNKYYTIGELLPGADIVLHTYSSAHSEAVLQQKKIINIVDIPSEEIADFRKNRFHKIKSIIDKAGNNVSVRLLTEEVLKAKKANESYWETLGGMQQDTIKSIIEVIKETPKISREEKKRRRLKGYFYKVISELENRFDDYDYFAPLIEQNSSYINDNYEKVRDCISYIQQKKIEFGYMYIRENWKEVIDNPFDRAYALRFYWENNDYLSMEKIMLDSYLDGKEDASFYCFQALLKFNDKNYDGAKIYAKRYIELVENIKYEKLDSEKADLLELMKGMISSESSGFCAN